MLAASGDQTISLWDTGMAEQLGTFCGHTGSVKTLDPMPGSRHVFASGARDGQLAVWDTRIHTRTPEGGTPPVLTVQVCVGCQGGWGKGQGTGCHPLARAAQAWVCVPDPPHAPYQGRPVQAEGGNPVLYIPVAGRDMLIESPHQLRLPAIPFSTPPHPDAPNRTRTRRASLGGGAGRALPSRAAPSCPSPRRSSSPTPTRWPPVAWTAW